MEWSDDIEAADWWIERLRPFSDHVVASMIPRWFDAVTRIFHPIEEPTADGPRWTGQRPGRPR